MRAGFIVRIDHRFYPDRLSIEPTQHMGARASQMQERGLGVSCAKIEKQAANRNGDLTARRPKEALYLLTEEKSVFTLQDVAHTLHRLHQRQ
jgi:hypothetical protein